MKNLKYLLAFTVLLSSPLKNLFASQLEASSTESAQIVTGLKDQFNFNPQTDRFFNLHDFDFRMNAPLPEEHHSFPFIFTTEDNKKQLKADWVLWGPWIPVEPGEYHFDFIIKAQGDNLSDEKGLYIDLKDSWVPGSEKRIYYYEGYVNPQDLQNGKWVTVGGDIKVDKKSPSMEFRLWWNGTFDFQVAGVILRPKNIQVVNQVVEQTHPQEVAETAQATEVVDLPEPKSFISRMTRRLPTMCTQCRKKEAQKTLFNWKLYNEKNQTGLVQAIQLVENPVNETTMQDRKEVTVSLKIPNHPNEFLKISGFLTPNQEEGFEFIIMKNDGQLTHTDSYQVMGYCDDNRRVSLLGSELRHILERGFLISFLNYHLGMDFKTKQVQPDERDYNPKDFQDVDLSTSQVDDAHHFVFNNRHVDNCMHCQKLRNESDLYVWGQKTNGPWDALLQKTTTLTTNQVLTFVPQGSDEEIQIRFIQKAGIYQLHRFEFNVYPKDFPDQFQYQTAYRAKASKGGVALSGMEIRELQRRGTLSTEIEKLLKEAVNKDPVNENEDDRGSEVDDFDF